MSRAEAAFTLFEVMAAVALLGILYTVLAGVASQGLRSEGEARRRLEASLLADRALANLEAAAAAGLIPPVGESEEEEEPFRVLTKVQNLVLPVQLLEAEGQERDASAPTLFPQRGTELESPVRRIDVVVSWEEAGTPRSVVRTTFAFDLIAAEAVLASIPGPEAAP